MGLKSPNMQSCSEKKRCLSGPNQGLAYDPADPCPTGTEFNSVACDCSATATSWGICATYQNSCTEELTCRCQVFGVGASGVPTLVTDTSTGGSETCLFGTWSVSFRADFGDSSFVNIPIASGVSSEKQNLISYEVVYDQPTGGYPCIIPPVARSVWHADEIAFSYFGCGYTCQGFPPGNCSANAFACSNESFSARGAIDFTTNVGPTPHTLVPTLSNGTPTTPGCNLENQCDPGDPCAPSICVSGSLAIWFRIQASDGTWVTNVIAGGGVGGTFCVGEGADEMCSGYPEIVDYIL